MGSLGGFAHEMFEFSEDLLNGVQVGAVGRKEQQACTDAPDGASNSRPLVAGEIVHDHHIACRERWDEALFNVILEAVAVDRLIHDAGRVDPVTAQRGKESHGFPMAVGCLGMKPLALGCPASQWDHVRLGPSFVNEDQPSWIKPPLILFPLRAPPCDLWPELFGGQHAFF